MLAFLRILDSGEAPPVQGLFPLTNTLEQK